MANPIVEHLIDGVKIVWPDGREPVVCKPLTLKRARQFLKLWVALSDPDPEVRVRTRIELLDAFAAEYPELEDRLAGGDVERLVPGFSLAATGAAIAIETPESPTGTTSGAPTSPSGASSPTP